MTWTRTFHVGDILSLMTGRLVSPDGINGLHALAEHMAGEPVWTHQLPRVSEESEQSLRDQFPDLAAIEIPTFTSKDREAEVKVWITNIANRYGATRDVEPLGRTEHTSIGPIEEMRMMRPDMPIIAIETGGNP
jgi:hypothetical protein